MFGHRQRTSAPTSNSRTAQRLRRNAVMGVHALSFGLMCVAVACPNWGEHRDSGATYGLWKYCLGSDCYSIEKNVPSSLTISRAFLCTSLVVAAVGVTLAYIVLVKELLPDYARAILAVVLVITGVCAVVGVGVMGGDFMKDDKTQWCLPLAIMAAILFLANGLSVPKVITSYENGSIVKVSPRQAQSTVVVHSQTTHHNQPQAYAETNPDYPGYNQGYYGHGQGHAQPGGYHGYGQAVQPAYNQQPCGGGAAPHYGYMDEPPPAYA